jgi:hypothetical protein
MTLDPTFSTIGNAPFFVDAGFTGAARAEVFRRLRG